MPDKARLCVDFDGTIFDGENIFPNCITVLTELRRTYRIAIFSARATDAERQQMIEILNESGVPYDEVLPPKPDAVAFIDDKGVRFQSWNTISIS
jgi:hypothetical protein